MPTEGDKQIALEIGHVLFIDIVGYSKLLITDQSEQLQKLKVSVFVHEPVREKEEQGGQSSLF
jgi:hypothetical protein